MSLKSAWTGDRPHIDESELRCKTGCGFFGNPVWDGHCSQCYKELVYKRQQRKTVFDPTNIKNKVSRSVSDVSEFQSKASSMMSRKFDKFEEKRKQQLDKKTKAVKSIFKKSQSTKGHDVPRITRQLSGESQSIVTELQGFLKTINREAANVISQHIKGFMDKIFRALERSSVDELGEQVHEFYNRLSHVVSTHSAFVDFTQDQVDKVNELSERYITTRLYKAFIIAVNADSEEKDLAIQTRIRSLMWVSTSHLECKVNESDPEVRIILDNIITELIEIDSKRVPMDKLSLLVSASHQVLNLLKQSSGGVPASADDFLPALIYCVLKANPPLLQSNLCYITNFAQQNCLMSGEAGYFFTNLCCAVSFIEKLTADSLGLTQHEFDRYMSGDALPPNALDGTYSCEGMRLMQDNIDHLTQMEATVNKLIDSYDDIMSSMDSFKDNLISTVDQVLEKTPLTIRPKKANIDEPDPTQELLPPPMMPQSFQCDGTKSPSNDLRSVSPLESSQAFSPSEFLEGTSSYSSLLQSIGGDEAARHDLSGRNLTQDSCPWLTKKDSSGMMYDMGMDASSMLTHDPFLSNDPYGSLRSFDSSSFIPEEPSFCPTPQSNSLSYSSSSPYYANSFSSNLGNFPSHQGLTPTAGPDGHQTRGLNFPQQPSAVPLSYTGFSVQGGRIPSIPCDTGVGYAWGLTPQSHTVMNYPTKGLDSEALPPDPLSPPPQSQLPPPLVPTCSNPSDEKKENSDRKGKNLLGDIVDAFDSLI